MKLQVVFKNCSRSPDVRSQRELQFRNILLDTFHNVDILYKERAYYLNTKDALSDYPRVRNTAWKHATRDLTEKERKNARFELHFI